MSKISTIHDQLISLLGTLFSDKQELVDPYELENNDSIILANGYGITIDNAIRSEGAILERYIVFERDVNLILTEKTFGSERDVVARETVEKNILEDQLTAIAAFEQDSTMRAICDIDLVDDNGIEKVFDDKSNFWTISSRFKIKYEEIINPK